jgi:hypothetical protein
MSARRHMGVLAGANLNRKLHGMDNHDLFWSGRSVPCLDSVGASVEGDADGVARDQGNVVISGAAFRLRVASLTVFPSEASGYAPPSESSITGRNNLLTLAVPTDALHKRPPEYPIVRCQRARMLALKVSLGRAFILKRDEEYFASTACVRKAIIPSSFPPGTVSNAVARIHDVS